MAAARAMKEMMDQLMGATRDEKPSDEPDDGTPKWQDEGVCKGHLVLLCPHDLFHNTKSDLGVCLKKHDEGLKTMFNMANDAKYKGLYAKDLLPTLEELVADVERTINRTRARLSQVMPDTTDPVTKAKIQEIMDQVKGLQDDVERLGEEGEVEQAEEANKKVALLLGEKERIEKEKDSADQWMKEKTQTICEVCGCIAQSTDNEQRKENHLQGKQHKGFVAIRAGIQELKDIIAAARKEDPDFDRSAAANGRDRSRERLDREREARREEPKREEKRADDIPKRDRSRERERDRDRGSSDRYRASRDYRSADAGRESRDSRDSGRDSGRDRGRDRSRSRERRR
ncbi:hypothetical protein T484DRAFT_1889181 [Baffinella frigidus]|nr:hypothetical protein T484DRAFT_1889181 [Cryptophyta sp. CCMP2293]